MKLFTIVKKVVEPVGCGNGAHSQRTGRIPKRTRYIRIENVTPYVRGMPQVSPNPTCASQSQ